MKRYITIAMVLMLVLVGCGSNKETSKKIEENSNTVEFKVQP